MHEDMHQMSLSFLRGHLPLFLKSIEKRTTRELNVENPDDNKRKRIIANTGAVIIHYSSEEEAYPRSRI